MVYELNFEGADSQGWLQISFSERETENTHNSLSGKVEGYSIVIKCEEREHRIKTVIEARVIDQCGFNLDSVIASNGQIISLYETIEIKLEKPSSQELWKKSAEYVNAIKNVITEYLVKKNKSIRMLAV